MESPAPRRRGWLLQGALGFLALLAAAVFVFWGDLVSTVLDPKVPFQTYNPPPQPDYALASAWYLRPGSVSTRQADIFFVAPTTYDGGRNWNARIDHPAAAAQFREVMAPNYVGPFVGVGRVFAPRYRQASLYSLTTLREDAREARQFAYADVRRAFRDYLGRDNGGRPFFIVGVEQGGALAMRLLSEEFANDPRLETRLVAAYLIETLVPAENPPLLPCVERNEAGCLAAWASVREGDFEASEHLRDRALVWNTQGELVNLSPRPAMCFNPLLGAVSDLPAPARLHLGAANATGLEWGARPAFMMRKVSAQCRNGVLVVSRPRSADLQQRGSWADRRKVPGFNLFYADLDADSKARLAAWNARQQGQQ